MKERNKIDLWELNRNVNTLKHARVEGAVISLYHPPPWTIAPSVVVPSYLTMSVLSAVATLVGKLLKSKARKNQSKRTARDRDYRTQPLQHALSYS